MWELFHEDEEDTVERKAIAEGWLVRVTSRGPIVYICGELGLYSVRGAPTVTTTFRYDPKHEWNLKRG